MNLFLPVLFGVRTGSSEFVFGPRATFTYVNQSQSGTSLDEHAILFGGVVGVALRSGNVLVMPEVNLATIVQTSCNQVLCANNTGGLAVQAGIGIHFDR